MVARDELIEYGFVHIGNIDFPNEETFSIKLLPEHQEANRWEKAIYAFVIDGKIRRIGSSKGRLGRRFNAWNSDVTKALRGLKSATPKEEADKWRACLKEHKRGEVYARVAEKVTTRVGTFEAYMDEESILIQRYWPTGLLLNRHKNR